MCKSGSCDLYPQVNQCASVFDSIWISVCCMFVYCVSAVQSVCVIRDHSSRDAAQYGLQALSVWSANQLVPGSPEGPRQPRWLYWPHILCCYLVLLTAHSLPFVLYYSLVFLLCFLSGRHEEALAIAERGRTRAFADLLVERQKGSQQAASADPYIPVTVEHILETVNSQRAIVLYYSLAGGFLYSWLICPGAGMITYIL